MSRRGRNRDTMPGDAPRDQVVSPSEWLACGEALVALSHPPNMPRLSFWHELVAARNDGTRDRVALAIMDAPEVRRAVEVLGRWTKLVCSVQLGCRIAPGTEESVHEHLLSHLAFVMAPKPPLLLMSGQRVRPYPKSWMSEGERAEELSAMWIRSTSTPRRRREASPWSIAGPCRQGRGEGEADPRRTAMEDPCWLAGLCLDFLCKEFVYERSGSEIEVRSTILGPTELFQRGLIGLLDRFVASTLRTMGGFRSWFRSEMLDPSDGLPFSPYWSFWASRRWTPSAAHLAAPLGLAALPTTLAIDVRDYLKRLAKDAGDHSSQQHRPRVEAIDPSTLARLIEDRS